MYEQLSLFAESYPRECVCAPGVPLAIGTQIGKIVLGDVITARVTKVEGGAESFFYRTDIGCCFDADSRTDIERMEQEARHIRARYEYQEIDFAAVKDLYVAKYPPRKSDGRVLYAMVGVYKGMLLWKEDMTYQFLVPVENISKAYKEKLREITHSTASKERLEHSVIAHPPELKRMYWVEKRGLWSEANFAALNGARMRY